MSTEALAEQMSSLQVGQDVHSIGQLELNETDHNDIKATIDKATSVLTSKSVTCAEFVAATEILQEADETLKLIDDHKKKKENKNWKVLVLPFSRAKDTHYSALGILPQSTNLSEDEFFLKVQAIMQKNSIDVYDGQQDKTRSHNMKTLVDEFWQNIQGLFLEYLEDAFLCTNEYTEERSRMIINLFLQQLIYCLRRKLRKPFLLFPELTLATAKKPVEIRHGKTLSMLTGRADYCVIGQFGGYRKSFGPSDVSKEMEEARSSANLEEAYKAVLKMSVGTNMEIFFVEAKKYGLDLEKFQPQIVVECVAAAKSSRKNAISWCLTDGLQWIFGVVFVQQHEDPAHATRFVYRTPTLEYNPKVVKTNLQLDENTLKQIFSVLVLWSTEPAEVLGTLFQ